MSTTLDWRNESDAVIQAAAYKKECEVLRTQLAASQASECRMREALTIYADPQNWECARCHKQDALNCGLLHWRGPCEDQPYTLANEILSAADQACTHKARVKRLRALCGDQGKDIKRFMDACDSALTRDDCGWLELIADKLEEAAAEGRKG